MPAPRPCRRIIGSLIVLIAVWPMAALAETPRALPGLAACDGQTETDITQTPITVQDPAVTRLLVAIQQTFDTALAENILKTAQVPPRMADSKAKRRPQRPAVSSPVGALSVKVPVNATAAQTLATMANPTFGARDGMAVSIHQQLVESRALNTDIRFVHQTDAIDAGFNLAARQSLDSPDPMAMHYEGRAMLNLGQTMQFGLAARGTLGTLEAPRLDGIERVGPTLHFNLKDRNLSLISDFGYDFGLNPTSAAAGRQFRAKLDLRLSL